MWWRNVAERSTTEMNIAARAKACVVAPCNQGVGIEVRVSRLSATCVYVPVSNLRMNTAHAREIKKEQSYAGSAAQRSLRPVLAYYPPTASSAQFCLLCCQPEPIHGSLAARMSRLTPRDPCRLLAWLG
jgi:hypothetical protein